jgi:hypothetical protein
MKKKISLILILLLSNSAIAEPKLIYLEKNEIAPFTGYLINPEMEKKFRLLDSELDYQKKINLSLKTINNLYEENELIFIKRLENNQKQIENLNKRIIREDSIWGKLGMFLLGGLTTTLLSFGVNRASK